MIPVTGGNIAPPKNKTNHRQNAKILKLTKGTGKAKRTAKTPK